LIEPHETYIWIKPMDLLGELENISSFATEVMEERKPLQRRCANLHQLLVVVLMMVWRRGSYCWASELAKEELVQVVVRLQELVQDRPVRRGAEAVAAAAK
jgi:hypothetical protein